MTVNQPQTFSLVKQYARLALQNHKKAPLHRLLAKTQGQLVADSTQTR